MNCREAEELIPVYLLGALDERERAQVETHIRECPTCLALFHEHSPVATLLSSAGDPLQPPPELKQRVLDLLGSQSTSPLRRGITAGISSFIGRSLRRPLAVTAAALAAISLIGLSAGTLLLWSEVGELRRDNSQLSSTLQAQISELEAQSRLSVTLQDWLGQMQEEGQRLSQLLLEQRDLAYTAAIPGISTIMLEGAGAAPKPRGMFMISPQATWAMLAALNLPPLPEDKAYQLWLTAGGTRESGGIFTVDETGYGQLAVRGKGLITRFQSMGVSVEPAQGSAVPTGAIVLGGVITSTGSP